MTAKCAESMRTKRERERERRGEERRVRIVWPPCNSRLRVGPLIGTSRSRAGEHATNLPTVCAEMKAMPRATRNSFNRLTQERERERERDVAHFDELKLGATWKLWYILMGFLLNWERKERSLQYNNS